MKLLASVIAATAMSLLGVARSHAQVPANSEASVVTDAAPVYQTDALSSPVITRLNNGDSVTAIQTQFGWTMVKLSDGRVGYISQRFLAAKSALAPQPSASPTTFTTPGADQHTEPPTTRTVIASDRDKPEPAIANAKIVRGSKVYIDKMDGFETYLAAAFVKKKVDLVVVADPGVADYVITGNSDDKKAGWAKIVFLGNIHSDNAASVTMVDEKTSAVVFAYAVNKKSTLHGDQTTAEACAKHLEAKIEGREQTTLTRKLARGP